MKQKQYGRKILFWGLVAVSFVTILVYNVLTPQLSDDLLYQDAVRSGSSFFSIFQQEYIQYMNWTGRSVNHIILRSFLWGDKWLFNICNSLVFVGLLLLMYDQIQRKKKHDWFLYCLLLLLVWMAGVDFGQTVLWETGACNYLWGTVIILGHVTLYRRRLERYGRLETEQKSLGWAVLLFFTGLIAGWCNENTSGGGLLLLLSFLIPFRLDKRTKRLPGKAWMYSAPAGMLTGFAFMVLAPGNSVRSAMKEETAHSGLLGLAARSLKIVLAVKEQFFLCIVLLLILLCLAQAQKIGKERLMNTLRFTLVALATSFALLLAPETQDRAHFGAGIFLLIAIVQCFADLEEKEAVVAAAKRSFVAILGFIMIFTYVEEGANLMRIKREVDERDAYIWQQREMDKEEVTAPLLRPDWQTPYSYAYGCDIKEDRDYWINQAFAQHYLLFYLDGVPREEWDGY